MIYSNNKQMYGMSLIELMVGMALGLFLLAGVFTIYVNGRASQTVVDDQVAMIDDARFALQVMTDDLRQAGLWGRVNEFDTATFAAGDASVTGLTVAVTDECVANWADYGLPVAAFNGASPYTTTCTPQYSAGTLGPATDVLEIRYTLGQPILDADLQADMIYVASDVNQAAVFQGAASPGISTAAANMNFPLVVNAYYIASWSNVAGDGIPSLHKVSLEPGPVVVDQMLLAGVENLQVQYGVDTDGDGAVNQYVASDNGLAADWAAIRSVQISLIIRSQKNDLSLDTSKPNVAFAGGTVNLPNDGWRRNVISTVVNLRNAKNSSGI